MEYSMSQAQELVLANRILYRQGVVDAFGHVSVRHADDSKCFLMTRGVAPGLAVLGDVIVFGLDGEPLEADEGEQYSERFIHAAIYAARRDVMGVVHSHSPSIIPFTVTGILLQPMWTLAAFLGPGVAQYDPQEKHGDTTLLVKNMELGGELAVELGPLSVALMRGHGSVAVGRSLREAVARAIYTEVNAKLQADAMRMGAPIKFLSPGEAKLANDFGRPDVRRPWELWVHEIEHA
jgi:ribulose-5-phosphate 4-epimerase/fuculose-1-phosphate aldolase